LKESYRKTDKLPFGGYVAYNGVQRIFKDYGINIMRQPFDETWNHLSREMDSAYSLYFLITKNLVLSDNELKGLTNYVSSGNDIFISADYIDEQLLQKLLCKVDRRQELSYVLQGKMQDTHVSVFYGNKINSSPYSYFYFPFLNELKSYDRDYTRVLGVNEKNEPNYALFFLGKGRVYLHLAPRVFSNYFLLTRNNYQYFENIISFLRLEPKRVYWDEYYKNITPQTIAKNRKKRSENSFSSLRVIKENPPLLWAFSIALAGMLIFVLFNIKRKQRIIPVVPKNNNATVAFTETIGRLYFQYQNNRHVADNMITYFYEYIRNKYFLKNAANTDEFIDVLSGKSGVSQKETAALFSLIKNIQQQDYILDEELMELNLKIETFKNKSDGRNTG
jgi:hypothetical protein